MSVGPVLTLGLGSFGSPSLIITLGYGAGVAPPDSPFSARNWRKWYQDRVPRAPEEEEVVVETGIVVIPAPVVTAYVAPPPVISGPDLASIIQAASKGAVQAEAELHTLQAQKEADRLRARRRKAKILLLMS